MIRRLLLAAALCAASVPAADAWLAQATAVGASYTGPGDLTSFTGWWGLRAYTGAIAAAGTQTLVNLSRQSDTHTCDILVASNGGFGNTSACSTGGDNGQSASSFCNATTCNVLTAYDQTGNGRPLSRVAATAPTLVFNCINTSLPCMNSDAAVGQQLASGSNFTPGAGRQVSISVVGNGATGASSPILFALSGSDNILYVNAANTWRYFGGNAGNVDSTLSDSAFHAANVAVDLTAATSTFNGDGTDTTSTNLNNSTAAGLLGMARSTNAGVLKQTEAGFADATVWNGTVRTNLCHNQRLYYATPGSC